MQNEKMIYCTGVLSATGIWLPSQSPLVVAKVGVEEKKFLFFIPFLNRRPQYFVKRDVMVIS